MDRNHMCLEKLLRIVTSVDEGAEGFREWSEQSLFLNLLAEQRSGRNVFLHCYSFNHGSLFLHSILVPIKELDTVSPEGMMRWSAPHDSWSCGQVSGGGQPTHLEFSEPLSGMTPNAFQSGQKLVFRRAFVGRIEDKDYYEIAQFLAHAHD